MAIALVAHSTDVGSTTFSLPAVDTTGATLIVVTVAFYGEMTQPYPTITDNKGNSANYVALTTYGAPGQVSATVLFYCASPTVGAGHIITIGANIGEPMYGAAEMAAFSGIAASSPFQSGTDEGTDAGTSPIQPGSITPSGLTLVLTTLVTSSVVAATINDSFTITDQNSYGAGVNIGSALAYLIQASGSTINPTWTTTGSTNSAAAIAAFSGLATFSITGNAGVAGATVAWTGTSSGSTTADGSGNYTISSLANGSYTVTASKTGYSFTGPTPANPQVVSGANLTNVNFTATQIQVTTTTLSPAAGSYGPAQTVTFNNADSGLSGFAMYYTTDGTDPTTGSTQYSTPITVSSTQTVKVLAVATGYANSAIASALYTINGAVATSTFNPTAGSYGPAQVVTLLNADSALSGFAQYYTLDGTNPTTGSTLYTGPITVNSSLTIKVLAVATNYSNSNIASAAYTINGAVTTTTFSPGAGRYATTQTVTFENADSGLSGFAMYYTTDGSTPTTMSTQYSTPISVSTTQMVKVLAVATGYSNSAIASAFYIIGGSSGSGGAGSKSFSTEDFGASITSPNTSVMGTNSRTKIVG